MSHCIFSFVFFFQQKPAYEMRISDWSSDVCSSDLAGFYAPLAELDLEGAAVAVVGAGGAARAVLFALARAHVGKVTIFNRSPLKAMGLLATFGLKGDVVALDAQLPPVSLLVNSTSLGMKGQPPLTPPLPPLPECALVSPPVFSPLHTA